MSLTKQAQETILAHLKQQNLTKARYVVDATCGNGFDTEFLVKHSMYSVFGFDLQQLAIDNTLARLNQLNDSALNPETSLVALFKESHANLFETIEKAEPSAIGAVDVVMFNLGYLPKSDKQITTQSKTTIKAISDSLKLLSDEGIITVVCYQGHAGGAQETHAIMAWLEEQHKKGVLRFAAIESHNASNSTPILLKVTRSNQTP